jgi:hypothetical protein
MNQDFIIVMFLLFFLFCKSKNNQQNENFTSITEEQVNQLFENKKCGDKQNGDDCKFCDEGKTFGSKSNGKTKCGCKNGLCVNRNEIN